MFFTQSTNFQPCRDYFLSSWVEPVLSRGQGVLLKGIAHESRVSKSTKAVYTNCLDMQVSDLYVSDLYEGRPIKNETFAVAQLINMLDL